MTTSPVVILVVDPPELVEPLAVVLVVLVVLVVDPNPPELVDPPAVVVLLVDPPELVEPLEVVLVPPGGRVGGDGEGLGVA